MKYHLLTLAAALLSSFSIAQNFHPDYFDGELYLKFNENFNENIQHDGLLAELESFTLLSEEEKSNYEVYKIEKSFFGSTDLGLRKIYRIYFNKVELTEYLMEYLQGKAEIEYAEQVPLNRTTFTPDDFLGQNGSPNSWHLHRISAEGAWEFSKGNSEIVVAIVDDAVQITHPDLAPNLWVNSNEIPNDGIDNDGNGYVDDYNGVNVIGRNGNANPPNSNYDHGSHVAGISAAATNNGLGISSIGFNTAMMGIRASNNPSFITHGYEGISYAVANGAHVINCSWGGGGSGNTSSQIIANAISNGVVVVAAAGNDNVSSVFYPAGYNNVIAVASTAFNDSKSGFSNYGNWITVSAPGSNIWSTDIGTGYRSAGGTSMASPLVAGLCGLMLSLDPTMSISDVRNCLTSTADNINAQNPSHANLLGAGRINAENAMMCVNARISSAPTPDFNVSKEQICHGEEVTFEGFSVLGLAGTYQWSFPGGIPSSSNLPNPTVRYNNPGNYDVSLTLGNNFGTNTTVKQSIVNIDANSKQAYLSENFSGNPFSNNWFLNNQDGAATWIIIGVPGSRVGNRAALMNFFNYNNIGTKDIILTPMLDFSESFNYKLSFDHAYSYNSSATGMDSLNVRVSIDGGISYPHYVARMYENGNGNMRTTNTSTNNFIPTNANQWCFASTSPNPCNEIDLSDFDGEKNVRIMFEAINGSGNNLVLNNIVISGACENAEPLGAEKKVIESSQVFFYPNPTTGILNVQGNSEILSIEIYDLNGRLIQHAGLQNNLISQIQMPSSQGLYFVKVQTKFGVSTAKILVNE